MQTTIKYFAYLRTASRNIKNPEHSTVAQEGVIRESFPDLDIEFVREDGSAFISSNRPAFLAMLDRIHKGERTGLIALHPDRLYRNMIDASTIIRMTRVGEIRDLKFITYKFENTPEGRFGLQMSFLFTQYESGKRGEIIKLGIQAHKNAQTFISTEANSKHHE